MKSTDRFLLTGAGFTANFGGPLASELWAMIFNYPDVARTPRVRKLLLANYDFEGAYHTIIQGDFDENEKSVIRRAVSKAYEEIDAKIRDFKFVNGSPYPVNIYRVQELIGAFSGSTREPGYFFTLNQDLSVERLYFNGPRPTIPGVKGDPKWFTTRFDFDRPLAREDLCNLPSAEKLETELGKQPRQHFYYLKLHGSFNWRSALSPQQMVIGHAKEQQILSEPLLALYFDVFRKVLSKPQARLLIIGYGFADPHVNAVLADAVAQSKLRIAVMSPESPASLAQRLQDLPRGPEILEGLFGYYQSTLAQLCPADQSITSKWHELKTQFFDGKMKWPGAPQM